MSQQPQNFLNEVYNDAGKFGKFMATIGVVIAFIILCFTLYFGLKLVLKKSVYTEKVFANILKTQQTKCTRYTTELGQSNYSCDLELEYTIENIKYNKVIKVNSTINYANEDIIEIYYPKNNPTDISSTSDNMKTAGYVILGFGVFIFLGALFSLYVVSNFKLAAAGYGAGSIIRGAF